MRPNRTIPTMKCQKVQSILDEYLAGELDFETRQAIGGHLAACRRCQSELNLALKIDAALRNPPKPEPPSDIFDDVAAYVKSHPRRASSGWLNGVKQPFRFRSAGGLSNLQSAPIPAPLQPTQPTPAYGHPSQEGTFGHSSGEGRGDYNLQCFHRLSFRPLAIGLASAFLLFLVIFGAYQQYQQARVERASRELHFALNAVRYAMYKAESAVDAHLPEDTIAEAPQKALALTLEKVNASTRAQLSPTLRYGLSILTLFSQKEPDKL